MSAIRFCLLGILLISTARLATADELPPGQYQLSAFNGPTKLTYCLIKIDRAGGQLKAGITATHPQLSGFKLQQIKQSPAGLLLVMNVRGQAAEFHGSSRDADGSRGALLMFGRTSPAKLEPTDKTEIIMRDALERLPEYKDFLDAANERDAKEKVKALGELIQAHADSPAMLEAYRLIIASAKDAELEPSSLEKLVEEYAARGRAWHPILEQDALVQTASNLVRTDYLPGVALPFARRAHELTGKDWPETAKRRAELTLAQSLINAGETAEAERVLVPLHRRAAEDPEVTFALGQVKERTGDLDAAIKLWASLLTYRPAAEPLRRAWEKKHGSMEGFEQMLDAVYSKRVPPFEPERFARRQSPSANAVVLMELFTGAMCPPCVAADVAFDALHKTYTAKEVILLQYHLHIPGPDPMTTADSEARAKYYEAGGTPSTYFNGKSDAGGGGGMQDARAKYDQYREVISPMLESAAAGSLKLQVLQRGDTLKIDAAVADLAVADKDPPQKLKLRLAVVEETVRYPGSNGIRLHHGVVRGMPGGADGIDIDGADFATTQAVSITELRDSLSSYLADYEEKLKSSPRGAYAFPAKPLDLEHLKVVAFVQDEETKQVLLAAEAPVETK